VLDRVVADKRTLASTIGFAFSSAVTTTSTTALLLLLAAYSHLPPSWARLFCFADRS